jgi:hypothetical protein
MTIERETVLNKIRALLAKTLDNGCSEAEAVAALDKAQAMKDAYGKGVMTRHAAASALGSGRDDAPAI